MPYFGPVVVSGGIALVAFVQFGTFGMALSAAGIALVITTLEGFLLTPWLIGHSSGINAVVVFASVIVGGWLWGPVGLLLGVPILMIIKTVCDHVESSRWANCWAIRPWPCRGETLKRCLVALER